jgi:photosystem II stability/assembly factor-like uncharacterized protein
MCIALLTPAVAAQWHQLPGPNGGRVTLVTTNASNGYVFAIAGWTNNQSIITSMPYRSTDNGASWTPLYNNLEGRFNAAEIISVGPDTYLWGQAFTSSNLYHSTNYGTTWNLMAAAGLPTIYICWEMHKSGANLLVVNGDSLYKSTDHGNSFTAVSGLPGSTTIGAFAERGTNLYAGSNLLSTAKGIFRSTDNGANWTQLPTPFITSFNPLSDLTANAIAVFAGTGLGGVYRCTDTGQVWTKVNPDVSTDFSAALVATATHLYSCGTGGSVYRSDSLGNGWGPVNTGLPPSGAAESHPSITASSGAIIVATNRLGTYRTVNLGASWMQSVSGLHAVKVNDLLAEAGRLFVAADSNGFFRSTDQGGTWANVTTGTLASNRGFHSFARTPNYLLAGCGTPDNNNLLYRSTNDGTNWTLSATTLGLNSVNTFWVGTGDTVWAAGNAGLSRSVNGGLNWTFITAGIGLGETVLDLLKDGAFMFAGENVGGCKRSTNSGGAWNAPYLGLPTSSPFASIARLDTLWFVTTDEGVYRSYNRGNNWSEVGTSFSGQPWSLLFRNDVLYLGTTDGVWTSTNRGVSWQDWSDGFPDFTTVLQLAADDDFLYAGTDKLSVWGRSFVACPIPQGGTGDVNQAGGIVTSDIIYLVNYVLKAGPAPLPCTASGDVNCDGNVATSDIVYLVNFVLKGGPAPCDVCALIPATWSCP